MTAAKRKARLGLLPVWLQAAYTRGDNASVQLVVDVHLEQGLLVSDTLDALAQHLWAETQALKAARALPDGAPRFLLTERLEGSTP